jgi:predicted RNase H-like nuclease
MPQPTNMTSKWVAGVDGCPGGWIAVIRPLDDPSAARAKVCETFSEILALVADVICIDMPIGLPALKGPGGRTADRLAREKLGQRKASVFSVPSRSAVMELEYASACTVAQQTSNPSRKVSKQAFYIFPKIREIDALMTPALQSRVYETHPEVAFWALNRDNPLELPKRLKTGRDLRLNLLAEAGYLPGFLSDTSRFRQHKVGKDDLLDAAVCSWTAARIATGKAYCFPNDPDTDANGLRMEIRA